MKSRLLNCLLFLTAVVAAACGDDDPGPTGPPPDAVFHGATVSVSSANTVSAAVRVTARGYDSAFLRFWREGSSARTTPDYAFGSDTVVTASALGLLTNSRYSIEVNLVGGGFIEAVDTLSFDSGSRPGWIPDITPSGADPTPGFLTLSLPEGAVIINNDGRPVWWFHAPDPILNNFQPHPNGVYTLSNASDPLAGFRVLDERGETIGNLICVDRPTRFHEMRVLAGGDYWIMCDDPRIMDLTSVGGMDNVLVTWTVIQHHSASGQLLFEWNSFDHFSITDNALTNVAAANAINLTHGNALALDTDGNLIASFRELGEITKINVTTGEVMWRFGGLANQFTIQNDPKGSFERQHGLVLVGPGPEIQLLDNSDFAPSRLVRYRIDPVAMTATLTLEFIDGPLTHSPVGGATQAYTDGKGLVSFGRAGRVVETTASGARSWELTGIDGVYVFRAQRIPSLYGSELGDSVP